MNREGAAKKSSRMLSKKVLLATASIVIVLAVILSVLWLGGEENELFSLSQIQGGFVCKIRQDSRTWLSQTIWIGDEHDGDARNLRSDDLGDGLWAIEEYRDLSIGNLVLHLYVIDVEGDGKMGRGDSIIVTAENSTDFSSNATYEFGLWVGTLAISGTEYTMSFWFEDGVMYTGNLESKWYFA